MTKDSQKQRHLPDGGPAPKRKGTPLYKLNKTQLYQRVLDQWHKLRGPKSASSRDTRSVHQFPPRVWDDNFRKDQPRPVPLHMTDLEGIRALGSGSYGTVLAARVRRRRQPHALDVEGAMVAVKVISKRSIRATEPDKLTDMQPYDDTKNYERRFLSRAPWHPFVSNLLFCAVDPRNFYLVSELGVRGTLAHLIVQGPLHTEACRFYFANIIIALEFIHKQGIVHSDLKPENIFIGEDGYLMIGDFGLSDDQDSDRDWGRIGTTAFMPPECIEESVQKHYRRAIDMWSAAFILYSMVTGRMAFHLYPNSSMVGNTNLARVEQEVRIALAKWKWPAGLEIDSNLKKLMESMVRRKVTDRLGTMCPTNTHVGDKNDEIRNSEFFQDFPWDRMERRELLAPLIAYPVPDDSLLSHRISLPAQRKVPHLPLVQPPAHLVRGRHKWSVYPPQSWSPATKRPHDGDSDSDGDDDHPKKKRRQGVMRRSRSADREDIEFTAYGAGSTPRASVAPTVAGSPSRKRRRDTEYEDEDEYVDTEDTEARQMAFRTKRRRNEEREAAPLLTRRVSEGENEDELEDEDSEGSPYIPKSPDHNRPPTPGSSPSRVAAWEAMRLATAPRAPTFAPAPTPAPAPTNPPSERPMHFETSRQREAPQPWSAYAVVHDMPARVGLSRVTQQPPYTSFPFPSSVGGGAPPIHRAPSSIAGPSSPHNMDFEALPQDPRRHRSTWRPSLPSNLQRHAITGPTNNLPPLVSPVSRSSAITTMASPPLPGISTIAAPRAIPPPPAAPAPAAPPTPPARPPLLPSSRPDAPASSQPTPPASSQPTASASSQPDASAPPSWVRPSNLYNRVNPAAGNTASTSVQPLSKMVPHSHWGSLNATQFTTTSSHSGGGASGQPTASTSSVQPSPATVDPRATGFAFGRPSFGGFGFPRPNWPAQQPEKKEKKDEDEEEKKDDA